MYELKQLNKLIDQVEDHVPAEINVLLLSIEVQMRDLEQSLTRELETIKQLESGAKDIKAKQSVKKDQSILPFDQLEKEADTEIILAYIMEHQLNVLTDIHRLIREVLNRLNDIDQTEYVEKIAESRIKICELCKEFDTKGDKCMVPSTQPCCSLCGCSMQWKSRSMSSECPAGKW